MNFKWPFALSFAAALFLFSAARADDVCDEQDAPGGSILTCLVKTSNDDYWTCVDDHNHTCNTLSFNEALLGFSAAPPVTIASSPHDPGAHTPNPFHPRAVVDKNGDGLGDIPYNFATLSLLDLGTYHYHFTGISGNDVDHGPMVEQNDDFTVFDHPPTADMQITSGQPFVGQTIVITSNANDVDGGSLQVKWSVPEQPAGSTSTLNSGLLSSASLKFLNKFDIGHWKIQLVASDIQSLQETFSLEFDVPNRPPVLTVDGDRNINALEDISLDAGPAEDADGETLKFQWDIVSAPPHATPQPETDYDDDANLDIPTGADEIGNWSIRCTATDEHGATDSTVIPVVVKAVPPEIEIDAPESVKAGQTFTLTDTVKDDAYGKPLKFKWALVQVPDSAGVALTGHFSTDDHISRPTTLADAGSWIFRLTVTDSVNQTATKDVPILVDAPPKAVITGSTTGGTLTNPIALDGRSSYDPDSPDDPPDNGHKSSDGTPVISGGITTYQWAITEVPPDVYPQFFPGSVDDVLGIAGTDAKLNIPSGKLPPGQWTFQLTVTDAENNPDPASQIVYVINEHSDPWAVIPQFQVATTDVGGVLAAPIILDGSNSFDPDNVTSLPAPPGIGITNYAWQTVVAPNGCPAPQLPSGPAQSLVEYYSAGAVVPPACQGLHEINLQVTDDDTPAGVGGALTQVRIGNCPQELCIDYPTHATPVFVEFSSHTDVVVYYHLDSAQIEAQNFAAGFALRLEVYSDTNPSVPFYSQSVDAVPLPTNEGGSLAIHWDGFGNNFARPPSGKYSLVLKLLDQNLQETGTQAAEPESIWIQTLDVSLASSTTRYADHDALVKGTANIQLNYEVTGSTGLWNPFDQLRYRVYPAGQNTPVQDAAIPGPFNGHFTWNGKLASNVVISTGTYEMQIEAFLSGLSLGASSRVPLTVYHMSLQPQGGHSTTKAPGAYLFANTDDDNANGVIDLNERAAGEDDLLKITARVDPPIAGQWLIESSAPIVTFWSDTAKTTALLSLALLPSTGPVQCAAEGQAGGSTSIVAHIRTDDGLTLPSTFFAMTVVDAKIMTDTNNDFKIGAGDSQAMNVRPGLWDFAFRLSSDTAGGVGTLYNEQDESLIVSTGNPNNFIGRDSRRFYFQVTDPSADKNPTKIDEITIPWYTIASTAPLVFSDKPPTHPEIHLEETGPHTGVFVSQAQMLVTDDTDRSVQANTGLKSHPGNVGFNKADHRDRMIRSINDLVGFDYSPSSGVTHAWRVPLFRRSPPDERKHATIQVYNFFDPADPSAPLVDAAVVAYTTTTLVNRYRPAGIEMEVRFNPATDNIRLPAGSGVNLNSVATFFSSGPFVVPSTPMITLINLARTLSPNNAANRDTLYLMWVGRFSNAFMGESFPDFVAGGGVAQNFVFIAGRANNLDYVPAHEIGHMVTDEGHYDGTQLQFDIMRQFLAATHVPQEVTDNRRFWDDTTVHGEAQITRMRASRFVKGP